MQWLENERFGNAGDGNLSISSPTTDAPIDSACTGTAGARALTATNGSFAIGQIILIHQTRGSGAGQWELNVIAGYTAGEITTKYDLAYTYVSGAQVIVVKQYANFTVDASQTLTAKAWDGSVGGILAVMANGAITVNGALELRQKGFRGATSATSGSGWAGEGTAGASVNQRTANGNGAGGGQERTDGAPGGGGAGNRTAGTDASDIGGQPGGDGGIQVGNAAMTLINLGGGGGKGGNAGPSAGNGGNGGRGSGIFFLFAPRIVFSSTASALLDGQDGVSATDHNCGGGGAGAPGCGLFKCNTLSIHASATIRAAAASGGSYKDNGTNGGPSGVGGFHVDYSDSYTGATTPTLDATKDRTLAPVAFGGIT